MKGQIKHGTKVKENHFPLVWPTVEALKEFPSPLKGLTTFFFSIKYKDGGLGIHFIQEDKDIFDDQPAAAWRVILPLPGLHLDSRMHR